jgi:hypothetical protein
MNDNSLSQTDVSETRIVVDFRSKNYRSTKVKGTAFLAALFLVIGYLYWQNTPDPPESPVITPELPSKILGNLTIGSCVSSISCSVTNVYTMPPQGAAPEKVHKDNIGPGSAQDDSLIEQPEPISIEAALSKKRLSDMSDSIGLLSFGDVVLQNRECGMSPGEALGEFNSKLPQVIMLRDTEKYNQAESDFLGLYNMVVSCFGPISEQNQTLLNNFGSVYNGLAEYSASARDQAAASRYYLKRVEIFENAVLIAIKVYGPSDLRTANDLANLAGAYEALGSSSLSDWALSASKEIFEGELGGRSSTRPYGVALQTEARHLSFSGKYEEAESLYRKALEMIKEDGGPLQINYVDAQIDFARALLRHGNCSESKKYYESAFKDIEAGIALSGDKKLTETLDHRKAREELLLISC